MNTGQSAVPMAVAVRPPSLLYIWVSLHVLDVLLSLYLIGLGGREGNPLLAALEGPLGTVGMLGFKLSAAGVIGLLLWQSERWPLLHKANIGIGVVVLYNAALVALAHLPSGLF